MNAHKQNEPPHGETWQGDCWHCQYFSAWQNFCNWYGIELNGHAAEPTCRNPELKTKTSNDNQNAQLIQLSRDTAAEP